MIWNNRGYILEKLGHFEEALNSYDKALKIESNFELSINNRKRLLNKDRESVIS
jgi:Flp pilus assembly protein TadD